MNNPNRAQLLAESLRESARKTAEDRDFNGQVARIAAIVTPQIIAAEKAETSKPMSCPSCGAPLPESFTTDPVTSETSNDDDDEIGEYDNRSTRLTKLARSLVAATNRGPQR
jgi:hypothetical protein